MMMMVRLCLEITSTDITPTSSRQPENFSGLGLVFRFSPYKHTENCGTHFVYYYKAKGCSLFLKLRDASQHFADVVMFMQGTTLNPDSYGIFLHLGFYFSLGYDVVEVT
jgi:hypothetical protein